VAQNYEAVVVNKNSKPHIVVILYD